MLAAETFGLLEKVQVQCVESVAKRFPIVMLIQFVRAKRDR